MFVPAHRMHRSVDTTASNVTLQFQHTPCCCNLLDHHHSITTITIAAAAAAAAQALLKLAVEEAKELADVRSGRRPVTNHRPLDFTKPDTWEELDSEESSHGQVRSPTRQQQLQPRHALMPCPHAMPSCHACCAIANWMLQSLVPTYLLGVDQLEGCLRLSFRSGFSG
jgi:hypothetical protein